MALAGCDQPAQGVKVDDGPTSTSFGRREAAVAYAADATPEQRLATLLAAVHGPMPRALLQSRWTAEDPNSGETVGISLSVPGKLRMDLPGGGYLLAAADAVHRVSFDAQGARTHEPVDGELEAQLLRYRDAVEAMVLAPLYEARDASATDSGAVGFAASGRDWRLEFAPSGVPSVLGTDDGTVQVTFDEWSAPTSTTLVPHVVTIDGIGERVFEVDAAAVAFEADYFATEGAPERPAPAELRRLGGEERPTQPVLVHRPPRRWVVGEDPGTWTARREAFWEVGWPIHDGGGELDGFAWFYADGGSPRLAIPYRSRTDQAIAPAFPEGWRAVERPAGQVVVVYAPAGDRLDDRVAAGTDAIRRFAADQGLELDGSPRAAPYIHLHEDNGTDAEAERSKPICLQWDVR